MEVHAHRETISQVQLAQSTFNLQTSFVTFRNGLFRYRTKSNDKSRQRLGRYLSGPLVVRLTGRVVAVLSSSDNEIANRGFSGGIIFARSMVAIWWASCTEIIYFN